MCTSAPNITSLLWERSFVGVVVVVVVGVLNGDDWKGFVCYKCEGFEYFRVE